MGNELMHYGVLGMKWGVRKDKREAKKQDRLAKKDAKEYARAKMFYGEGAGNRRKLIKATVNERSKDKRYAESFEKYLNSQDMAKHASAAKKERAARTTGKTVAKTARGVVRQAAGITGSVAASAIVAYQLLKITGMDKVVMQKGQSIVEQLLQRK